MEHAKKMPINVFYLSKDSKESPYFFIKWSDVEKRYRVSASFKYLNKKYGIRINIVRDLKKIQQLDKIYELFRDTIEGNLDNGFRYKKFYDQKKQTEIFYIEREWDNEVSCVVVFFSLKYWKLDDYLQEKDSK